MSNLPSESNASEYYSAVEVISDPDWSVDYEELKTATRKPRRPKRSTRNTRSTTKSFQVEAPIESNVPQPELVLVIDSDEEFEKELLSSGFKLGGDHASRPLGETIAKSSSPDIRFSNQEKTETLQFKETIEEISFTEGIENNNTLNSHEKKELKTEVITKEHIQPSTSNIEEKKHRKKSPKKKKRSVLMDDFFAIGGPEKKKKKKKVQESIQELAISDTATTTIPEVVDTTPEKQQTLSSSELGIVSKDDNLENEILEDDFLLSVPDYSVEKENLDQRPLGRTYTIRLKSKITPHEVEYTTPDHQKFSESVREIVPYNMDTATLIWVEGKTEIKYFFRPSTLGIPASLSGEDTIITLLLIPKDSLDSFMDYPEFAGDSSKYLGDLGSANYESDLEREDGDTMVELEPRGGESSGLLKGNFLPGVSVEDYFIIGLKGSDNRRIEVQVSSETKLIDVLEYYLKQKGLDLKDKKAKLIFDDEELELDGKVGDTELEEEFEVQVVV